MGRNKAAYVPAAPGKAVDVLKMIREALAAVDAQFTFYVHAADGERKSRATLRCWQCRPSRTIAIGPILWRWSLCIQLAFKGVSGCTAAQVASLLWERPAHGIAFHRMQSIGSCFHTCRGVHGCSTTPHRYFGATGLEASSGAGAIQVISGCTGDKPWEAAGCM